MVPLAPGRCPSGAENAPRPLPRRRGGSRGRRQLLPTWAPAGRHAAARLSPTSHSLGTWGRALGQAGAISPHCRAWGHPGDTPGKGKGQALTPWCFPSLWQPPAGRVSSSLPAEERQAKPRHRAHLASPPGLPLLGRTPARRRDASLGSSYRTSRRLLFRWRRVSAAGLERWHPRGLAPIAPAAACARLPRVSSNPSGRDRW